MNNQVEKFYKNRIEQLEAEKAHFIATYNAIGTDDDDAYITRVLDYYDKRIAECYEHLVK